MLCIEWQNRNTLNVNSNYISIVIISIKCVCVRLCGSVALWLAVELEGLEEKSIGDDKMIGERIRNENK